ncbi:hypothetical protein LZF95_25875 [Algoriphagus sp. AGSA1]|uniref:hypothetical protein n=1 Tax=Algoriphagus sp. AGSA1 TaxID=2907213 RepID=UPI001F38DF07|nr:hypothetical protein [Algoriphagus sp. AGSA1]MCE7058138.1 hypothetical protein [Algoriphagus sp. AGSA1]
MATQFNTINFIRNCTVSDNSNMIYSGLGQEWLILLKKFIQEQDQRNEAINQLLHIIMESGVTESSAFLPKIIELQNDNIKYLNIFKEVIGEECDKNRK